jgi:TfoX N-terminal domain
LAGAFRADVLALSLAPEYDASMATRPITDPFVLHACELLSCLGPVQAKRMFGGYGLSVDGMNVAIIAFDTLFLKTNVDTGQAPVGALPHPARRSA